jgi:hypothetical protein
MKLKSLILGSVAAAGLSTAGFAADLGVLTSLDVCDALGLSGLTISSDTNCLQLSGGVSYEFAFGDFRTEGAVASTFDGARNIGIDEAGADWNTKVEAWLKAVGTADSDFGPAQAVIKIKEVDLTRVNGTNGGRVADNDGERIGLYIDEAYVSVGDTTVIMAGKKGSIANLGDDAPFNFLGLFNSDAIDGKGVGIDGDDTRLGGHVIQVVSDLGNGVNVGVGLENLNDETPHTRLDGGALTASDPIVPTRAGTLVGVVSYAGEGITAHLTGAAFGILDGDVQEWAIHAGATGTFDAFKVRGAVAYRENFKGQTSDVLNALASVEGTFDLFKIALSGEVANVRNSNTVNNPGDYTDYGFGGSIGVNVSEGVDINLGARYFFDDTNAAIGGDKSTWQVAAQIVAAVTETIKVTGEVGGYFGNAIADNPAFANDSVFYGAAELAWAPGGGFTSSLKGELNSESSYKVTFKAAKSFE